MAGSGKAHLRSAEEVLIQVQDLVVEFSAAGKNTVKAVSGISLDVMPGETLGLVGESGCGKSTVARSLIQLPPPSSGSVVVDGVELTELSERQLRTHRTGLQMIFQDPISSLNPRRRVADIVSEPLRVWGPHDEDEQAEIVDRMLYAVGLDPEVARDKRPHEFSGGQCQRISIARSLVLGPKVLICDEPVSSLDVSVQAQILNLLRDLKAEHGLTLVFIAHDLAVVKNVSDRVAVMYLGKLCEVAEPDKLFSNAAHPYTALLLESVPEPDPAVAIDVSLDSTGEIPSSIDPPSGCRFRTRCPQASERCTNEEPQMREVSAGHYVACHRPLVAVAG